MTGSKFKLNKTVFIFFVALCGCTTPAPQNRSQSVDVGGDTLFITQTISPDKVSDDGMLIAPIADNSVYLLNRKGDVIHKWAVGLFPHQAKIGPDGLLYGLYKSPLSNLRRVAGYVAVHDKDGKEIWHYEDVMLHHALEPMPNGHVLGLRYQKIPDQEQNSTIKKSRMSPVCDEIVEIDPSGKTVWSLSLAEFVGLGKSYKGSANADEVQSLGLTAYCHTNAVRYYSRTVFSEKPAVLVSMRNLNLVLLIEKESKKLLWTSQGLPLLTQHDPRIYGDQLLVFNNNANESYNLERSSQVLLINMKTRAVKELFGQKPFMFQNWGSTHMSGAEFLSNGNLLIAVSGASQVWEVTADGQLVFKMQVVSPKLHYEMGSGFYSTESYPQSFLKQHGLDTVR